MITALGKVTFSYIEEGYSEDYNFGIFDFITTEDSCYLSIAENNKGKGLTNTSYWRCIASGKEATAAAREALTAAGKANSAYQSASQQATYAKQQGDYAKSVAEHPMIVGDDYYVYTWNFTSGKYDKTNIYLKGEDLHFSDLTEAEINELVSRLGVTITQTRAITSEELDAILV